MTEIRLYPPGTIPECATVEWYADRDRAPHIDQDLHRPRLLAAARFVVDLAAGERFHTIIDLGAGDGGLLELLGELLPDIDAYGYDLQPSNIIGAAERGVSVRYGDVLELAAAGKLEVSRYPAHPTTTRRVIAVCTEMLEHLVDPHQLLRQLAAAPPVGALVASSPWTETNGGAYEHHLWAWDEAGYAELLESTGWTVIRQERVGMFTVLAATPTLAP